MVLMVVHRLRLDDENYLVHQCKYAKLSYYQLVYISSKTLMQQV